jgi:hypothetical protein
MGECAKFKWKLSGKRIVRERRLDLGEDVGVRLAHSAGRQPRNIGASCITVSARKFCQSLGHTVGILEVILYLAESVRNVRLIEL